MGKNAIDTYKALSAIDIALPGESDELQELATRTCEVLNNFKDRNPEINPVDVGGYRIFLQVLGSMVKLLPPNREPTATDIWNAWRIYTFICYKYEHVPTRKDFEIACDRQLRWDRWFVERSDRGKVLQDIFSEMDGAMMQHATEHNSVGGIYASKALYGHADSQPQVTIINNGVAEKACDIAAKYGMVFESKAEEMPEVKQIAEAE